MPRALKLFIIMNSLKRIPGEVYHISLFDKIKGQKVKALLGYSNSKFEFFGVDLPREKSLILYSEQGKKLGDVNINFGEWEFNAETDFQNGLPKPFVRLHLLKNDSLEQYKGVGSTLIQASIEKSLRTKAKGKIYVKAYNSENMNNDPFVFYNKMGLSLKNPYGGDPDLSKYIDCASKQLNIDENQFKALMKNVVNSDIEGLSSDEKVVAIYKTLAHQKQCRVDQVRMGLMDWMYLYEDKINGLWLPKIEANPLFSDSNRLK